MHYQLERVAIQSAKKYMEKNIHLLADPYTTSVAAYALTKLHSNHAPAVRKKLHEMSIKSKGD